jgi:Tfp pilus assembly protein PilF
MILEQQHYPSKIQNPSELSRQPKDISLLVFNAKILIKNSEYSLASHLLRKALYLNSFHQESLKLLVDCFHKMHQSTQALRVLFLLDRIEESFESAFQLAHYQYETEHFSEAKESYFRALNKVSEQKTQHFEVYKNLGNIFLREGDAESAEEFYHKAFALNPASSGLLVNLGTLAFQRQEMELALSRFRSALEIDSKNDKAWVGLAIVHSQMGDLNLAHANIDSALDINPLNRTAIQLAAHWGLDRHELDYVINILTKYVSNVEYDEDISLLLTHAFCLAGKLNEAKLELERMLLWNPKNEKLHQIEQEMKGLL